VARFFYGENISFTAAKSSLFMVLSVMRLAPPTYKPPGRLRLGCDLLNATTQQLRASSSLVLSSLLQMHGCTIMCDEWDDITRNHLINLVYGAAAASFVKGTTELDSYTHEDAESIATSSSTV